LFGCLADYPQHHCNRDAAVVKRFRRLIRRARKIG
jgi:hypothetical protein